MAVRKNFANAVEIKQPQPFAHAQYDAADVSALQALSKGEASADQQKRALYWIINSAALTYDLEYRTDARDHAFTSGRRFTGLQIVKLLTLDLAILRQQEHEAKTKR